MAGFEWDDANRNHIARHAVTVAEVEEAANGVTLDLASYTLDGEQRFEDLGSTALGRILKIVTTNRKGNVRVITAYDATVGMKNAYIRAMVSQR